MLKVFVACQNVYEEKYIDKYDLHPLMVVGYEGRVQNLNIWIFYTDLFISGVFGVLFLSVALWPMYFITVPKNGILGGISLGPNGR